MPVQLDSVINLRAFWHSLAPLAQLALSIFHTVHKLMFIVRLLCLHLFRLSWVTKVLSMAVSVSC